ncbi:GTP-binding protein [Pediococcus siamensis]|uniref:GTP-binding protein n=1 Tax=Pediococcus siamensis TaxID=381829 RepID=UPI0039A0C607
MKHIVAGIVAHVDSGKTTLSEAMLYQAGVLRKLGRVDNGDAFLDPDTLEKEHGITIFSHQANLKYNELNLTLLDTPGHVDFAAQTEQVLSVLDYAILVVSAADGVQGYTRTLWRLLARYQVPTFIFINKMDTSDRQQDQILTQLQSDLSGGCLDFTPQTSAQTLMPNTIEEIAMRDDTVLTQFLETGKLTDHTICRLINQRKVFPCYFGAALKLSGVTELMTGLAHWGQEPARETKFGARVFKISHDVKGQRLTWIRVVGGSLHAKDMVVDDQKADQLRVYNGTKFTLQSEVAAGQVCAITGLTTTYPGQGLGELPDEMAPSMQPVLNYALDPKENDLHVCLMALQQLEDEDPQLHVSWSPHLQEIRVQIMGEIQLEILQQLLFTRFNLDVGFDQGSILYQETIQQPVEGVGHFEPLRHYSEVHLLLQPLPRGTGLQFATQCSLDILANNWQQQVLTSLRAKEHLGVLTGAPLTDIKITLVTGKASNVHSVGGDFREATWRAVRQGLMMLRQAGKYELLEPWYQFRLEIQQDQVGRAMTDIERMHGSFEAPTTAGDLQQTMSVLTGEAPVAEMQGYAKEVRAYTHGQGQLECLVAGYRPCHDAQEIISASDYQPVADLKNTPDSVFCAHGAGYPVPWDQVPTMAHVAYGYQK